MNLLLWEEILIQLGQSLHIPLALKAAHPLTGGDTSPTFLLATIGQDYFVKLAPVRELEMFSAEAEGLETIQRTGSIRCPRPLLHGIAQDKAFLVLEYIALSSRGNEADLGKALAEMHTHSAPRYGWHRRNTLGHSPQDNFMEDSWATFWSERRLRPQFLMARTNGAPSSLLVAGERLLKVIPDLLEGHTPPASLLHGDLWHGNFAFAPAGRPVIYDPAVYYGDREADLAMCALFGGFGPDFWAAYASAWPLPPGYRQRRKLYMLYHVLNHLNLFGSSYALQAQHLMEDLLAQ